MESKEIVKGSLDALTVVAERMLPRILSQICRDENSTFFGCADRNWWHYKMRDFPSIILQQSGATLYAAQKLQPLEKHPDKFTKITHASCIFWNQRAIKFRSFEEYYPWEEGYPPLAFSTLSIARMVSEEVVSIEEVMPGLKVASKQLQYRFEIQAANQQVAGLAALCWVHKISPNLVSISGINNIIEKTLHLQSSEGWFQEYDGPDLGYLSVTIDCLWDAFDAIGDIRLIKSAEKALDFLDKMTSNTYGKSIGMHNSRNTDYIVPYGITRFLDDSINVDLQIKSLRILNNIFTKSDCNDHFFSSVDDRYWCHYIGLSVFRSIQSLSVIHLNISIKSNTDKQNKDMYFSSSGYVWKDINGGQHQTLISMKKGGIFSVFSNYSNFSDFGWLVEYKNKVFVSHWWSNDWMIEKKNDYYTITGYLFLHNDIISNPINHLLLRASSFFMGRKLIGLLKQKFIFKKRRNIIGFSREILISSNSIEVIDKFTKLPSGCSFKRAPRASKRHVASADSFHFEDLSLGSPFVEEVRAIKKNSAVITTKYLLV